MSFMSFLPHGGVNATADDNSSDDSSGDTSVHTSNNTRDDSTDDDDGDVAPVAKRTRRVHQRRPMNKCTWWVYFISPDAKTALLADPDGKVANQFCQAF
jgi:lipocalin